MKILTLVLFTLVSLLVVSAQNQPTKEEIIDVNFCDLLKNPSEYANKTVRVTAIYRYGFEWSELYCPFCETKTRTWIEYAEDFNEKSSRKFQRRFPKDNATIKVTLVGKLLFNGNFGHLNGYRNEFLITKIENAKIISKSSAIFEYLPEKDKAKISCKF